MQIIYRFSKWFVEPNSKINNQEKRSKAKLLSTLLLFILLIFICYLTLFSRFGQTSIQRGYLSTGLLTIIVLGLAYFVSRTQWYETAVYIFAIGFGLTIIRSLSIFPDRTFLFVLFFLPVMLSSMVLSIKKTAVVACVEMSFILFLTILYNVPLLGLWQSGSPIAVLFFLFASLILLSLYHRNQIEQVRRDEFLQQEVRLKTYFDNATDWLFALDNQGRVSSINQTACISLGYSAAEIIGQSPIMFLAEKHKEKTQDTINEIFQGKTFPFVEVAAQNKNGQRIWLEIRGRKLFKDNEVIGTFHVARNITDRKMAEDARQRLNREIKLLYETGHRLGQKIDLNTVYKTIYESIEVVVAFKTFIVSSYDTEKQTILVEYVRHHGNECESSQFPILNLHDPAVGLQKDIILSGKSRLINNFFEEVPYKKQLSNSEKDSQIESKAYSAIFVPLKLDGQVIGMIQIHTTKTDAFHRNHLFFLEALSSHIIAAITNASLLKQSQDELVERQRAEEEALHRQALSETLQASIAILNSSLSLEEVLTQILIQLQQAIPYDSAAIQQKEGDSLVVKAVRGFENHERLIGIKFKLDANLPNAQVVRTQTPLALESVTETYPEFHNIASQHQDHRIYSWLGVPLIADGEVIGMITIDRLKIQPYVDDEIVMATTFANHGAIAMRNAALYHQLETHSESLERAVVSRTAELQRTMDEVRVILRNSPEAILFLTPDQKIRRWNAAARQLFEDEHNAEIYFPFGELVLESDHAKFKATVETAVFSQTTQRIDIIVQDKEGQQLEVNAALAPIYEDGDFVGIVCNLHDISQFKEVERLKDTFVSNVSHELRTPITNLRLHHDLLTLNPSKQDIYIDRLGREIDRLNIIIEDLLRISRLDQKRIQPEIEEVDLIQLATQYINDRQISAQNKQLSLTIDDTPTLPAVQGDPRLLEQVIGILLTNAMNYTPQGGKIHLSPIIKTVNNQHWAGLRISDSGPGIPQLEQPQLFTRFFRGQAATDSGEPGTGLGLAIAQEIMHLHNGIIEFDPSYSNLGSTFNMWLPTSNLTK